MIIGIGQDITNIERIEYMLSRYGERFEKRCFSEGERAKARSRVGARRNNTMASTYAKRYAAKEACAKALGTGLARGVFWKDMEVSNLPSGQPVITLHGNAKARAQALTPEGMQTQLHITLSDDYPHASAVVMIEALYRHST